MSCAISEIGFIKNDENHSTAEYFLESRFAILKRHECRLHLDNRTISHHVFLHIQKSDTVISVECKILVMRSGGLTEKCKPDALPICFVSLKPRATATQRIMSAQFTSGI